MKASQVIEALCGAWQKDIPAKVQEAERRFNAAQEQREHNPQIYHAAHAEMIQAKGSQGRLQGLRTTLLSFVREFGDVEVPIK